jgi:hypothetical protein
MSERIKLKIGEELYNQILAKGLKSSDFDLLDGFVPRSRLNEVNDKLKLTENSIKTYENKIKETKDLLDKNEEFKQKYESLSEKYEKDLAGKDEAMSNISKKYHVETALLKEGAKHISLLSKEIDFSKLSIEGENVLGLNDTIKGLKKSYPDFFTVKTASANGANGANKATGQGNTNPDEIDWDKKLESLI